MADRSLYPTKTRLALLRAVADGEVWQNANGESVGTATDVLGVSDRVRRCTADIAAQQRAGWVDRALFACKPCWWRLPLAMRRAVTDTHRVDQRAHREAMADAMQWYRDHPRSSRG